MKKSNFKTLISVIGSLLVILLPILIIATIWHLPLWRFVATDIMLILFLLIIDDE